jgi:ABC-type transport system involved in multi-copper enzyme maturation permease subunit
MTATTVERPHIAGFQSTPTVPLWRLVRVELRKITDTRSGRWLLITIALLTAAIITIFFFAGSKSELTFDNFVAVAGTPQGFLLPVLGILAITSEWSQRTGLVTFTLEPSRIRVVAAKFIAMVLLGLAAVALAFALGAVGNVLGMVLRDGSGSWNYQADWVAEIALGQVIGIVQGLAFGMLFMSSAAAIVLYYVLPIAWSILFNTISALSSAAPWVDLGTASQPLFDHDMSTANWAHLGVTTLIWVGVPLVLGAARLLRSEVK